MSDSEEYSDNPNADTETLTSSDSIPTIQSEDKIDSLEKALLQDHSYPSTDDENFQYHIYVKRDFHIHRIFERGEINESNRLEKIREHCRSEEKVGYSETQVLLHNLINPHTPYRGILIVHGTGVGKTGASVSIAEGFVPMVEKYGTKIHVIVPGTLTKQNYVSELLKFTGDRYLQGNIDKKAVLNEADKESLRKAAIDNINQYYRIMSHRSFYKKVLGEKTREKVIEGNKVKWMNRKTDEGELERDYSIDRIYSLDNTVLIVDEAHNLTDNGYGDAVKKIMRDSKNLRIVLLSATPMKNRADDIIELINYIRPPEHPMVRDKIFTKKGHEMEFRENGGREYFRKMIRGYVSYLRGADPLTFAERVDMGVIPPGLSFSKLIRCYMEPFQLSTYERVVTTMDDHLDQISKAVSNFVFPGLPKDRNDKGVQGYYGNSGIAEVRSQIKSNQEALCRRIESSVLSEHKIDDPNSLIYLSNNGKSISGDIFLEKYLRYFSIKFYTALRNINSTVYGDRGPGISFVYFELVRAGTEVFQEVLLRNGYLEYQEDNAYQIKNNTRCYCCNYSQADHQRLPADIPPHEFYPATFLTIIGKSDDSGENMSEENRRILSKVATSSNNKDGKYIKIIMGSKVMNEGVTLTNVKDVNILDVHFNLGRIDQAIGRGIRFCKHFDVTTPDNLYPKVFIFKYVVSLPETGSITGLSTEEQLYQKAEEKYKLVKEVERIMQEEAVDCPLNMAGNIFADELARYGDCGTPEKPCPAICGYMPCQFKCGNALLNAKYYDPDRGIYRQVAKKDLDYSTYNNALAREEIEYAKARIKELYRIDYIYPLSRIMEYVKESYPESKRDMFDDYYVYQGLDDLLPTTGNDFNNFRDTVTDKYNRPGYLIYRNRYYIFQPFDENQELPVYYRKNFHPVINNQLSLKDYIQNNTDYRRKSDETGMEIEDGYDFDSIQDYYDTRQENEFVGIIDRGTSGKKGGRIEIPDVFKIRSKRSKILVKKRQTGVPSFKGAECRVAKDKDTLLAMAEALNLKPGTSDVRNTICEAIKEKLYDLEKFTPASKKITYLIIPANHPTIPFPLNLEDRVEKIIQDVRSATKAFLKSEVEKIPYKGRFKDIKYVRYIIKYGKEAKEYMEILKDYGAIETKTGVTITVE
jgi:superfamily II DNA or RNA helicase